MLFNNSKTSRKASLRLLLDNTTFQFSLRASFLLIFLASNVALYNSSVKDGITRYQVNHHAFALCFNRLSEIGVLTSVVLDERGVKKNLLLSV